MEQLNFQICIQHQSTDVENSRQMSTSGKATEKWRFPVAFHFSLFSTFFVHGRCKNKEKLKTTTVCWKTYVTFFRYSVILWNFDASSIEAFTSSSVLMKSPAHIFFHRNLEENLRAYWIQIHPLTRVIERTKLIRVFAIFVFLVSRRFGVDCTWRSTLNGIIAKRKSTSKSTKTENRGLTPSMIYPIHVIRLLAHYCTCI